VIHKISTYSIYFSDLRKKIGLWGAIKYCTKKLATRKLESSPLSAKPDPVDFYSFIYSIPFGNAPHSMNKKTINWVIPDFGIGSGGHLNIFRVIKNLEELGFECRINIDGPSHFAKGEEARACIREHFFPIEATVSIGRDGLLPAAATFATSWTTAYTVRDYLGAGKRYYFVQDFEPFFYAQGSDYSFAEETYNFGFKGITAGGWLAKKLSNEYQMETVPFNFSFDRHLYKPYPRRETEVQRVFYYARPVTPRRAFELGLLTLAKIHENNPKVEFILAGWDTSAYHIPFPHLNAGVLPLNELPDLYSQCDIALVLSLTNASLLPLEVMACGCAVVSNMGENIEWLLNKDIARFSKSTPDALGDSILSLLNNPDELDELKTKGLEYARLTSWDTEVQKIAKTITNDLI